MPSSWNNFEDKKPQRGRLLRLEILEVYSKADGPEPARKQTVWMGCAVYEGHERFVEWNEKNPFDLRPDMEIKWKYWED